MWIHPIWAASLNRAFLFVMTKFTEGSALSSDSNKSCLKSFMIHTCDLTHFTETLEKHQAA